MNVINIAKDFSITPGARYKTDGDFSAELFIEQHIDKYFQNADEEVVTIVLDGTAGYSTSFLDGVFGGLARKYGADTVKKKLKFVSDETPVYIEEIMSYIDNCD